MSIRCWIFYYGKDKKGKESAEPVLWVAGLPDRRKYEEDFVIQIYARIAFGPYLLLSMVFSAI